jgi:hypothetical protein
VADSRPIDAQPTTSEEQSIERRAPEQPSAPPPTSDIQSAVQTVASIAPSDPRQAEPGGDPTAPGATETPATETRPPAPAVKLDPIVSRAEDRPAPDEAARTARDQEDASAADVSAEPSAQAAESAPAKHPSAAPPRLSQSEIDERLASALPRVEFVKVPLAQFVEFIGEFTNLPIVIDEPALHAIGKGRQSLVSVKLSDATAGEALRAATAKLGLTCAAREGKLVVTAAHRAAKAK